MSNSRWLGRNLCGDWKRPDWGAFSQAILAGAVILEFVLIMSLNNRPVAWVRPAMPKPLITLWGEKHTSVVLIDAGDGWFVLQTIDGGMTTGEIVRINPTTRTATFGTRPPAGWRIGGR